MKTRKADKIQSKLVTLLYGDIFTGKTTLGLQLAYMKRNDGKPFRVAVVDAEGGGVDDAVEELLEDGIDGNNVRIFYTQSLQELSTILDKIKNHEPFYEFDEDGEETDEVMLDSDGEQFYPDGILIDGTSIFKLTSEQGLLELSKKRNTLKANKDNLVGDERTVKIQGADLEFKDYKKLNFSGQNLVLDLMASGINVVLTAREKDEKRQIKESNDKTTSVSTGRKIYDSFSGMDYNCKTVMRMFQDEETGQICAKVIKDRTKVHKPGEVIEDPTLLDWQIVIDKNKDRKAFVLKNDLDKAVETEQEMYEKEATTLHGKSINSAVKSNADSCNNDEVKELKQQIVAAKKKLSPEAKSEMKATLEEKGLPTVLKSVTDIDVLKHVLETVSK